MKNELRKKSLEKRKSLPIEEYSNTILNNLFQLEEYKSAKNILSYFPLKYEVQTQICLNDKSKNWFLPRVNGEELEICPYSENALETGSFNIFEPTNASCNSKMDMLIIPAVAVDKNGYRIGYGKGYYDKFVSTIKYNPIKVILVYSDFVYEDISPSCYDLKADIIVTNEGILKF